MTHKGLIHIYTGDGKGKTTAALGLAMRARGHGMKVMYVYFHKDPRRWGCGEYNILKKIGVNVKCFSKKHPRFNRGVKPEHIRKECLKGLKFIKKIYQENRYDMLILDEINISLRDNFLEEDEILDILRNKPEKLELVLTGRGAAKRIIRNADLVSRVEKIKHPYDLGGLVKKGIEY